MTIRRLPAVLVGLLLALGVALPASAAHATTGSCTVTPNPVAVGALYTVAASGLTVNTAFTVHFQEPGVGSFDQVVASDSSGSATTSATASAPGTVSVTWKKWQGMVGGGGAIGSYGPTEAACSVTVV